LALAIKKERKKTNDLLYRSCGKSHGNERLKRKALKRLRKTDIEGEDALRIGADCSSTCSSNREGLIANGGEPCATDFRKGLESSAAVFMSD